MIRSAITSDFAAIDAFDPFAGDRAREIAEQRMLVFSAGDDPIAYVSWLPAGFVGRDYVTFLCVREDRRGAGVASILLAAVEARLSPGRLFISTEEDNAPMLTLLRRHGWIDAGAVNGANDGDRAELFFYKDLCPSG